MRGGGSSSEGVGVGWQLRRRQLGCWSWSWSRQQLLASAREFKSGTTAGEIVGVGDSVSKGVGVGDIRNSSVAVRASAEYCWRQQGRQQRLI